MPRNQEIIRQWKALHTIEASRQGVTINGLARDLEVTTRTIRRDLTALQEAGFPLYDERTSEGRVRWHLDGRVLKGLETSFSLAELSALYLSRNLLEAIVGTPFQRDLTLAFSRIEKLLSPQMRKFLDRLPSVLAAKPGPRTRGGGLSSDLVARLLEAILHHREMRMYYHSISSGRNKNYLVHPYRIAFAQGSLYLLAFVPEYEDMRTFAVDRIASASPEKQTFKPIQAVADDVFGNSLGVNTGPAKRVVIEFDSTIAPYVRARVWHPSQRMRERQDGSIVLTLHVCHDWALRSWILGWGSFAKVQAPPALAAQLLRDLSATATRYANEPGRKASHTTATLSHTQ